MTFLPPGVGYATQVIVALLNIYYIIVLAWAIFFLSNSFTWDLPWASCNNTWNTGETQDTIPGALDLPIPDKYTQIYINQVEPDLQLDAVCP